MQYTKKHLKEQLYQMGLNGTETILIHSSMKAIGDVEGGAETVLEVLMFVVARHMIVHDTSAVENLLTIICIAIIFIIKKYLHTTWGSEQNKWEFPGKRKNKEEKQKTEDLS